MKKIAAPIRVELAQYRELGILLRSSRAELDAAYQRATGAWERDRVGVLKQPQYQPMPRGEADT